MLLNTREWGAKTPKRIVCLHGVTHHSGVFETLGERLAGDGHSVIALDLRGHGRSGSEPPWNTDTHMADVIETLDEKGIERALWIGHSFGGRVAATLAAVETDRTEALVLLETALQVDPGQALKAIEIERLDWSFATADGAVNAMLASDRMVAPPRDVIEAFAREDLRKGSDGRLRFSVSPGAAVVAWNEMTLPPPPIASVPTLLVSAAKPLADPSDRDRRYSEALGGLQERVEVPNGHNILWESPAETLGAIRAFIGSRELLHP
jgi:pimeloyl-ACP methyl ester carboxylesterase